MTADLPESAGVFPHGHLGHLTASQEVALGDFKVLLEKQGLWQRGPSASHDDQTLLRFLRARRWVPADALRQFQDTEEWRKANDIEVLYRTIDLPVYEQSRRLYPQWTGRRDRRGIPLYVFQICGLDSKTISQYEYTGSSTTFSSAKTDGNTQPGALRLFALYENLTRFTMPLCSQLADRETPEAPITMTTNIVDVSGVGLKQFWNLKGHMQAASQLATAHYPETLDRIFIVGAPVFFSTVWGWIKRWFDPITVSKMFILAPHEVTPTLEAYIDKANIPKKYGGELDFAFGDLTTVDPSWESLVRWEGGHSRFPGGPLLWEEDDGQRMTCVQLGSEEGKLKREVICSMPMRALGKQQETPLETVDSDEASRGTDLTAATDLDTTTTTTTTLSTPARTSGPEHDGEGREMSVAEAIRQLAEEREKHDMSVAPAAAPHATVV